jgi:hypothetical protein
MTPAKAKVIFATHMQAARKRKLTPYELNQLSTARQVLRQRAKPAMNARPTRQRNPKGATLIYGQVDCIYATKKQNHICDDECKKNGHRYFHEFSSKPKMYGLPDGTLLIKP